MDMFEKMRGSWDRAIKPLVLRLGHLDPNILTWSSLAVALIAFYLLAAAGLDDRGGVMIGGAVLLIIFAGLLDGLDGAVARHQGVDGPYGDFLDHTIDRVVDVGLLVAIGANAAFVDELSSGLIAAVLTLLGSYMGTQAQSVGLGRIYGGFSRADRVVLTLICLIAAIWQAYAGTAGIDVSGKDYIEWLLLGNTNFNGMTAALSISAWGGLYSFLIRFAKARRQLLD